MSDHSFLDLHRFPAEDAPDEPAVTVLPLPYEGTVSWGRGAAAGPAALLEASTQVEWWDEVLEREPCQVGVETAPAPVMPEAPAEAVEVARQETARILERGRFPVVLGGEHSLSLGVYQALAERHPGLGVVQLDAHADLRDQYDGHKYSHACVMARVREQTDAVVQLGVRSLSRREAARMQGREGWRMGRQQRLTAGTDDVARALAIGESAAPDTCNMIGKRFRAAELAAILAIGADKVGVTELADRLGAVALQPAPEITARKAQENSRAPGLCALALQGHIGFLYGIGFHAWRSRHLR